MRGAFAETSRRHRAGFAWYGRCRGGKCGVFAVWPANGGRAFAKGSRGVSLFQRDSVCQVSFDDRSWRVRGWFTWYLRGMGGVWAGNDAAQERTLFTKPARRHKNSNTFCAHTCSVFLSSAAARSMGHSPIVRWISLTQGPPGGALYTANAHGIWGTTPPNALPSGDPNVLC